MPVLTRLFALLPKMVPLGVITVAVVFAWGRFYQNAGTIVCQAASVLGADMCTPGTLPDAQGLLDELTDGDGTSPIENCNTIAAGLLSNTGLCGDAEDSPERKVLVVGESQTFEYSVNLAQKYPRWHIVGTALEGVPRGVAPGLPNIELRGNVDATALRAHFSPGEFSDIVYNAPRPVTGWHPEAAALIDSVLVSAAEILRPGGRVRFSSGGGMPGKMRLDGHARGDARYPIPEGYVRPARRVAFFADEFGVRYTPRDNYGKALPIQASQLSWYIFQRS